MVPPLSTQSPTRRPRASSTLLILSTLILINTLFFSSTGTVDALPVLQPRRNPLAIAILGAGHKSGLALEVGDHGPLFSLRHPPPPYHPRSDDGPVAQEEKGKVSIRSDSDDTTRVSKRAIADRSVGPSDPAVGASADDHNSQTRRPTGSGHHEVRPLPIAPKDTGNQGEKSLLRRRKVEIRGYRPGSGGQYDKGKPYGR